MANDAIEWLYTLRKLSNKEFKAYIGLTRSYRNYNNEINTFIDDKIKKYKEINR